MKYWLTQSLKGRLFQIDRAVNESELKSHLNNLHYFLEELERKESYYVKVLETARKLRSLAKDNDVGRFTCGTEDFADLGFLILQAEKELDDLIFGSTV